NRTRPDLPLHFLAAFYLAVLDLQGEAGDGNGALPGPDLLRLLAGDGAEGGKIGRASCRERGDGWADAALREDWSRGQRRLGIGGCIVAVLFFKQKTAYEMLP